MSAPDVQLHFLPCMVVDHGRTEMRKDGYSLHVCTLRPESRGTIRLTWYGREPRRNAFTVTTAATQTCSTAVQALVFDLVLNLRVAGSI